MNTTRPELSVDASELICGKCHVSNNSDRRFCAKCGARLWEPCGLCYVPNAVEATYCGRCGTSLLEAFSRRHNTLLTLLDETERLRQDGDYLEAIRRFQQVEVIDDTRLTPLFAQIEQRTQSYEVERLQQIESISRLFESARRAYDEHDYTAAKSLLGQIPLRLRDSVAQQLLLEVERRIEEIAALRLQIKLAHESQDYSLMLARVTQLLKYRPQDDKLQRLQIQLNQKERDSDALLAQRTVASAKNLFLKGDYAAADSLIAEVSLEYLPTESQATYHTIRELGYLEREIKQAPYPLAFLDTCLARWEKLRPQDPQLPNLKQNLVSRRKLVRPETQLVEIQASKPSNGETQIPLSLWHGIAGVDNVADFSQLRSGSYRFHAAYGLALQGLGLAPLSINLMPKPSGGLLKRFSVLGRNTPITRVWGIDIGNTGIKAIELGREALDSAPAILNVLYIPHETNLGDVEHQAAATTVIKQSLSRFSDELEGTSLSVVLGFSGPKTLGRWFDIPQMDSKKTADAIAYEAKLQIPIPIDDINYDWHAWPKEQGTERSFQNVILLAARKDHINQHLDLVADLPIRVLTVQSICLALYNAAAFELLKNVDSPAQASTQPRRNTGKSPAGAIPQQDAMTLGVLDLGTESSNLVAVSPHFVRYRSMPIGTQRLDRELMKQLQLTRTQCEELRLSPGRARRLYQVEQIVASVFDELLNDLRRTTRAYESDGIRFDKLVVTGGGVEQLGVLRLLLNN